MVQQAGQKSNSPGPRPKSRLVWPVEKFIVIPKSIVWKSLRLGRANQSRGNEPASKRARSDKLSAWPLAQEPAGPPGPGKANCWPVSDRTKGMIVGPAAHTGNGPSPYQLTEMSLG